MKMKAFLFVCLFSVLPTSSFGDEKDVLSLVLDMVNTKVANHKETKGYSKIVKYGTPVVWKELLPKKEDIPFYLQDISVTIKSKGGTGSGVLKTRQMKNGEYVTFIWTAGHVVDDLKKQRTAIDPLTGTTRTIVEFDDAKIVKELFENGRNVGRLELDAEVIRFSDAENGEDLALMKLRKKNFVESSTVFYLEGDDLSKLPIPPLGTHVFHVGSLLGQMGSNSMTDGIIAQHGRIINKRIFDQTTVVAFPGSSGGGVFLDNGAYVGMLVRGAGEGFNLVVPIRRLRSWAREAKVEWAIDDNVELPSEEELSKLPVEDIGRTFNLSKAIESLKPHSTNEKVEIKTRLFKN